MSGQFGFQTTDPTPPMSGPVFAAEDIDELGLGLCLKVWRRVGDLGGPGASPDPTDPQTRIDWPERF